MHIDDAQNKNTPGSQDIVAIRRALWIWGFIAHGLNEIAHLYLEYLTSLILKQPKTIHRVV